MLTEDQRQFLNRICSDKWTEEKGVIFVKGYVNMSYKNLTQIPVQFGRVNGYFDCDYNQLLTLEGGPRKVHVYYTCDNNNLANLIGAPEICDGDFYCRFNQLTSLEGCPRIIKNDLYCTRNPNLNILYGIGKIEGNICYDNKNDLNEWIIQQAKHDIFVTYADIAKWIKDNNKFKFLLNAQQEIRQHFSPKILYLVDTCIC